MWRRLPLALLVLLLGAPAARAAALPVTIGQIRRQLDRQGRRLAARFAPKRVETPPAWARRDDPPRAVFAALADPHFDDTGRRPWTRPTRKRLLAACRFLNQRIRPDATLILGDLIAHEQPEQLRRVKALLEEHLDSPILPVHGNHDGPGFESVFGPANTARTIGGIRFLTLGITYWHWDSGWGRYERLDWLARTLAEAPRQPTLVLIHNPVCLPTFANNHEVLRLLDARPQVLAVLAGHMHTDYEVPLATPHFGLPMLIRPPYAFKVLRVHLDRILILTYEEADGAYRPAPIYQKIDIPAALRAPAEGGRRTTPAEGGHQEPGRKVGPELGHSGEGRPPEPQSF
jgi:predicted phosphodiesterase